MNKIRVSIRSGWEVGSVPKRRIRSALVEPSKPSEQPTLWLRDEVGEAVLYISGHDTLRKLRDALSEALGEAVPRHREEP